MPDHTNSHVADHAAELLTITGAADLLRAPVATLRYWRHCNTGPRSFRLGRRVLYRRDDLYAWIDAQDHQDNSARTRPKAVKTRPLSAPGGRLPGSEPSTPA